MIKVRPYKPGDVFHVDPMEKEYSLEDQDLFAIGGISYTVLNDDKIIGVFGFARILDGCFHLWSILSEEIRKFPIATYKITLAAISIQARRIQMTTAMSNTIATTFAYRMGFTLEGVLKKYGPDGKDHYLFAKVAA
jgi:RimJ/RimL family protein N-acetyltransferase